MIMARDVPPKLLRDLAIKRRDRLTDRQRSVLFLMAEGMSNQEIADTLGIGKETVMSHVRIILAVFDARDRTQAVARAIRAGELPL